MLKQGNPETQAWMQEMTNTVVQRTWATAVRTITGTFTIITMVLLVALFIATTAISPMAGVITAAMALVSLTITMWGVSKYMSSQSRMAMMRWKVVSDSLRPPPNGEAK